MALDYLIGRIEKVYLEGSHSRNCAIGIMNKLEFLVSNGNNYLYKECLVRFDLKIKGGFTFPLSNFLTTKIPNNFFGLDYNKYVLVGLWQNSTPMSYITPKYTQLEQHFDCGRKDYYFFFPEGRDEVVKVKKNDIMEIRKSSIKEIINRLPDPEHSCRLIVVENKTKLEEIKIEIMRSNLYPIELEDICKEPYNNPGIYTS